MTTECNIAITSLTTSHTTVPSFSLCKCHLHPLFSQRGAHISQHSMDVLCAGLLVVRDIRWFSSLGSSLISMWSNFVVRLFLKLSRGERADQQQQWKTHCHLHHSLQSLQFYFEVSVLISALNSVLSWSIITRNVHQKHMQEIFLITIISMSSRKHWKHSTQTWMIYQ